MVRDTDDQASNHDTVQLVPLAVAFSAALVSLPYPSIAKLAWPAGACNAGYSASLLPLANRTQVVIMGPAPFAGDVSLFGETRKFRVPIDAHDIVRQAGATTEALDVRSPEGIVALTFRPSSATCDVTAVRPFADSVSGSAAPIAFVRTVDAVDDGTLEPSACAQPYRPVHVVRSAVPDVPVMARQQGITGRVIVLVYIDERGNLTFGSIASSPSVILNYSALTAARQSTFQPALFRCNAIASNYLFAVDYMQR
jgi:TonB family protein